MRDRRPGCLPERQRGRPDPACAGRHSGCLQRGPGQQDRQGGGQGCEEDRREGEGDDQHAEGAGQCNGRPRFAGEVCFTIDLNLLGKLIN